MSPLCNFRKGHILSIDKSIYIKSYTADCKNVCFKRCNIGVWGRFGDILGVENG